MSSESPRRRPGHDEPAGIRQVDALARRQLLDTCDREYERLGGSAHAPPEIRRKAWAHYAASVSSGQSADLPQSEWIETLRYIRDRDDFLDYCAELYPGMV
jgi:hypothetical protein